MANRLTSSIFVASIIRHANASGGFATVLRHGADDAGAIFICVAGERGEGSALYAQAPQSVFADAETRGTGRLFELVGFAMTGEELALRFDKEARFDPDFWVIELELFGRPVEDYFDIA